MILRDRSKKLVYIFNDDVPIKNAECISIHHETFLASGLVDMLWLYIQAGHNTVYGHIILSSITQS